MGQFHFSILLLLFFIIFPSFLTEVANSSCPIDFSYVETFPWDSTVCHEPIGKDCCLTLRNLFGIGLSQHLKKTQSFYLQDSNSSSSCISSFQTKLDNLKIPQIYSQCVNDSANEYVLRPSNCAGIKNIQDWVEKIGALSDLDSACNADLTKLTPCSACLDAGMMVTTKLASFDPNNTKCFFFTCFYAAAIVNQYGPEDPRASGCILNIQMAKENKDSSKLSSGVVVKLVSGILGVVLGVLVSVWLFLVYRKWEKKRRDLAVHEKYVDGVKSKVLPNTGAKWFNVGELEVATSGFSQKNMLGQGGHGIVYKGVLSDGNVVAVKQIFDLESIEDDEFTNEAQIISKIRHRNLLALRGFCVTSDYVQGKRRYLVYDFMENGSLDEHLFNRSRVQLSWPQRKNVILDVAKGLAYLHHGIKPAIFHRDIKATNILLDTEMKAKVADFGLAKQSKEGQSHLTTRVAGTYGYLAPEYALYGQLTEKSDVYSFGIVILEVMSGRRALETSTSATPLIADWAWALIKSGNTMDILEESIRREGPGGVMERFVQVGILCAHVMVALRPTIADALKMLESDIDIPSLPDRPLPLADESFRSSYNSFAGPKVSVTKFYPNEGAG
ncbi:hypothetical protein Leryth_009879 [Lithospermum erythrorhizon]|nr:hypothetical protein Leryth_009879 [Lithospermum erythrorhizon]